MEKTLVEDEQKILINFLNSLKKENLDLENIKDFFELAEIWKITPPSSDFRKKINNKMAEALPEVLAKMPLELRYFFPEMDKVIKTITFGSKAQDLVLQKINQVVEGSKEDNLCLLVSWYQNWASRESEREREILFIKIKNILEVKNIKELFEIRSLNNWSKDVVFLIDNILSDSLPMLLPRVTSATFLFSLLEKIDYTCKSKELIQERLVEILENKFLFSIFSFDDLYHFWKLFNNKSKGQFLFKRAIIEEIKNMNLSALFNLMSKVDKMDRDIVRLFYEKISKIIVNLKKDDSNYLVFLEIVKENIQKKSIPEELISIFKIKAEEILLEG